MKPQPRRRDKAGAIRPETREETIERVGREGLGAETQAQPDAADPSARRDLGKRGLRWSHLAGILLAAIAFVAVVAAGGGVWLGLALAGAVLIGGGVVVGLLVAMREDGTIEREVEDVAKRRS